MKLLSESSQGILPVKQPGIIQIGNFRHSH
jgi:hypothetical protein